MVVGYERFGTDDARLYELYLLASCVGSNGTDDVRVNCNGLDVTVSGVVGNVGSGEKFGANAGDVRGVLSLFSRIGGYVGHSSDCDCYACGRVAVAGLDRWKSVCSAESAGSGDSGVAGDSKLGGSDVVESVGFIGEKFVTGSTVAEVCTKVVECADAVVDSCKEDGKVSEKTLANRQKRAKKKERKLRKQSGAFQRGGDVASEVGDLSVPEWRRKVGVSFRGYRGAFESCSEDVRKELADTRAKRLIAENNACVRKAQAESDRWAETLKLQRKQENLQMLKVGKQIEALRSDGVQSIQEDLEQRRLSQQLKIAQTRQKLELVAAQDVEGLKRRQASKVLRDTETNKVAVERAFGTLASSGNVPSLVGGKVYTVNSGSISPNSSASEAEVRAIQKKNLDLEKQVEELTAKLGKFEAGIAGRQDYDGYDYSEGITIDEDGHPIGDFGDAYSGYIGKDNRFHFGESMMPYFD